MKKYSYEFKLKLVKEYLSTYPTIEKLSEKYDNLTPSNIRSWVHLYNQYGKKGLQRSEKQSVYPVQFKLDVLDYRERTGSSYQKTADAFGIRFGTTVGDWHRKVQRDGVKALTETKGRIPMAEIERLKKEKKKQKLEKFNAKRFAKLERENELLRLELAYLKKLETFQDKRLPEKKKHERRTL